MFGLFLLAVLLSLALALSGCHSTEPPASGREGSSEPETTQDVTTEVTQEPTTELTVPGQCTHSYGQWQTLVEASCTKPGQKQRSCSLCGDIQIQAVAATCTQPGETAGKHCSVCNTVLTAQQVLPAIIVRS